MEIAVIGWPYANCMFPKFIGCLGSTLWLVGRKFETFTEILIFRNNFDSFDLMLELLFEISHAR